MCSWKALILKNKEESEEGQGIAEFALVFPVLFALILFLMDCGYICCQMAAFDYGCTHASWAIDAALLNDTGSFEILSVRDDSVYIPSDEVIENAVRKGVTEDSLPGLVPSRLTVSDVNASIKNDETGYIGIPDHEGRKAEAQQITRRLTLSAKLTYSVNVLTPLGEAVFGKSFDTVKYLDYERIVGKQLRIR